MEPNIFISQHYRTDQTEPSGYEDSVLSTNSTESRTISSEDDGGDDDTFGSFKDTSHMTDLQFRTSSVDCEESAGTLCDDVAGLQFEKEEDFGGFIGKNVSGVMCNQEDFGGFAGPNEDNFEDYNISDGNNGFIACNDGDEGDWAAFPTVGGDDEPSDGDGEEWAAFSEPDIISTQVHNIVIIIVNKF